jgi:hypothetical protein
VQLFFFLVYVGNYVLLNCLLAGLLIYLFIYSFIHLCIYLTSLFQVSAGDTACAAFVGRRVPQEADERVSR